MDETLVPKYQRYNLTELEQVLRDINRDKYPERVLIVEKEISQRLGFATYEDYKEFTKYGFQAILNDNALKPIKIRLDIGWTKYFPNIIPKIISIVFFAYYINYKVFVNDLHLVSNLYLSFFFLTILFILIVKSVLYYDENRNGYYEMKDKYIYYINKSTEITYNLEDLKDVVIMKPYFFETFKLKFKDYTLSLNILTPNYRILKSKLLSFLKMRLKNYDLLYVNR